MFAEAFRTRNEMKYLVVRVIDKSAKPHMKEFVCDGFFSDTEIRAESIDSACISKDPFVEFIKWILELTPNDNYLRSEIEYYLNMAPDDQDDEYNTVRFTNDPDAEPNNDQWFDNCRDEPGDFYVFMVYCQKPYALPPV